MVGRFYDFRRAILDHHSFVYSLGDVALVANLNGHYE